MTTAGGTPIWPSQALSPLTSKLALPRIETGVHEKASTQSHEGSLGQPPRLLSFLALILGAWQAQEDQLHQMP
jgi:hypothetical protein